MIEECAGAASPLGDLSPDEFLAWSGFVRAHAAVARGLDADLRAAHNLALNDFEILLWLSHGSCARMRMAALADSVQLSPSGLSRAIERLHARGLVSRQQCEDDRRGAFAILTTAGVDLVRRASATQATGIRRRFLAHLTPADIQALAPALARVLAANKQSCDFDTTADAQNATCPGEGDVPVTLPAKDGD